ncbi:MAG TPA: amidase [Candidatus Binatia bacterium]|jgi:Asp-tRNA(Asn)/Glu-tRNA(Gln) amidotransferase A subunit family amidase|nr:amidase [Candidatus Binatia bacterium]
MHRLHLVSFAFALLLPGFLKAQTNTSTNPISREALMGAEKLIGMDFSDAKIDMLLPGLRDQLRQFERMRKFPLSNSVPPALVFNPLPAGLKLEGGHKKFRMTPPGKVRLPANLDDLAFYSIGELGALIKTRQITSEKLTRLCLARLKEFGPKLECAVTVTEELAIERARRADREIAGGHYRGPLHGIPYGAKDLLATKGIPTTWGATPYTNQIFDSDATVIKRLEQAGAVLVVKTTLGELAMGEVWFGGKTRNPWNREQGSSGSSAGSCAATAAGLIPFGIGSETLGSIVSPSDRCGTTSLRPTFGRVSRAGAMTLSWTMDKLGPICRTVEDCAIVFNAIYGPDGIDQTVCDAAFNYDPRIKLKKLRIGYVKSDFDKESGERKQSDEATMQKMRALGVELVPVELPDYPLNSISFLLSTEAAAAFDGLTRTEQDDRLKQQQSGSWPNTFRERRFVPAVEYIQAQRIRYLLIQETARVFEKVDLFLAPSLNGRSLLLSNLTGHPCVVLPNGFSKAGTPMSVCFIGRLFGEGELLAAAKHYQDATEFHRKHPKLD